MADTVVFEATEEPKLNVLITGAAGYIGSIWDEILTARCNMQEGHRAAVSPETAFFEADLEDPSGATTYLHNTKSTRKLLSRNSIASQVHSTP